MKYFSAGGKQAGACVGPAWDLILAPAYLQFYKRTELSVFSELNILTLLPFKMIINHKFSQPWLFNADN